MIWSTGTDHLCNKRPRICSTCRKHFPVHSSFMTYHRVTRQLPQMEQKLLSIPEHMSSPPVLSWVCVTRSLVLCVMFCRSLFVLLTIVLSVLRFTDSDYLFGIFKLFFISLNNISHKEK